MKVSRTWLQKHFADPLPNTKALAEALTFHAFEIEEYDDDMLDVKVLPDRAAYALSHRGIAYELSAILNIPMSYDQLSLPSPTFSSTDLLTIECDPDYVIRHTGALVRGVKVGPSPDWLRNSLESVGQRSINNVVDALNCVMLATGQPGGAFDLDTMETEGDTVSVAIRRAEKGEKITVLTGEEYELTSDMFVFTDAKGGALLDIAGVKGGLSSGVTERTTNLFISCGTYDPTLIRRTSQTLKLFTDASQRFQNRVSPELTAYGMQHILDLIHKIAGGELVGVVDYYPTPQSISTVRVSHEALESRLGTTLSPKDVDDVFSRLKCDVVKEEETYVVTPPFYRRDITIPEDIAEEVGRIIGYDQIPGMALSSGTPSDLRAWSGMERIKDLLVERGFVEISTPAFGTQGDIVLANPLDTTKPYLRSTMTDNMKDALQRAVHVAPKVLGPEDAVRLFELGTVFTTNGEETRLSLGYRPLMGKARPVLEDMSAALSELCGMPVAMNGEVGEFTLTSELVTRLGEDYAPRNVSLQHFKPFSPYPFALRDVAVWSPIGTEESEVAGIIMGEAGELLARIDLFDRFEKEGNVSHAFRLVFESFEKTLSDVELTPIMERITNALNAKDGWQVR